MKQGVRPCVCCKGGYDAAESVGATTYNYDEVGNLQNFVYPNGATHGYGGWPTLS